MGEINLKHAALNSLALLLGSRSPVVPTLRNSRAPSTCRPAGLVLEQTGGVVATLP